jgi:hypothetical protein
VSQAEETATAVALRLELASKEKPEVSVAQVEKGRVVI